jgi:hypothetical protein
MIMGASERTHPSSQQRIRNNAKHSIFCRLPLPHGHPGRGYPKVFPLQFSLVVDDSSASRALALSLEDTTAEEQFQADLQRALQESQPQPQSQSSTTPPQHLPSTEAVNVSPEPNKFLSERAQLEKERLARQKRLRGDTDDCNSSRGPTPSTSTADSESDNDDLRKPPPKRRHLAIPPQNRAPQQSKSKESANVINRASKPGASAEQPRMFWKGEIRQTANMHVDPKKDVKPTFRLSHIIGEVCLVIPVPVSNLGYSACEP